jgi:hypothetical protein
LTVMSMILFVEKFPYQEHMLFEHISWPLWLGYLDWTPSCSCPDSCLALELMMRHGCHLNAWL